MVTLKNMYIEIKIQAVAAYVGHIFFMMQNSGILFSFCPWQSVKIESVTKRLENNCIATFMLYLYACKRPNIESEER